MKVLSAFALTPGDHQAGLGAGASGAATAVPAPRRTEVGPASAPH
jgi:hypothetical protein